MATLLQIPRLPFVPDPLGRIAIPRDLDSVTSIGEEQIPELAGLRAEQLDRIWDAARALYRSGVHPAVQLCVRRHGEIVLNRALGHARGVGPGEPQDAVKVLATPATPFCVYSTSKGITALLVHMLHDRGELDIFDRVTRYIPEYGAHGKGNTTIAHVLAHRAGVPTIPPVLLDLDRAGDREFIIRTLSEAKPFVRPGTLLAYHAISGGFILGEIIHRVTGRDVRSLLASEVLEPLRFRWGNYGVAPEDVDQVGLAYRTGPKLLPPLSNLVTRALGSPIDDAVKMTNDPRFLTSVMPAASVITTADELGRFFEIFRLGGELDGVRVMRPQTLRRALRTQARLELDLTLGLPVRYSYGLMLGADVVSLYGLDTDLAFGHLGLINIVGWADPQRGISCGLITSGKAIIYPEVARFWGLMNAIATQIPDVPVSERPF
ncbi:MAG: serine hydrolase domain-containing protein [Solirubrobacteraceae bacterium]